MDRHSEVPPAQHGSADVVTGCATRQHGGRCREVVALALRAFMDLVEKSATGETVSLDSLRRIAHAVGEADGALGEYYNRHSAGCGAVFELARIERQRTDFFGRAITQEFVHLFADPTAGIGRKNLPQFFLAVRMILGDEVHADYANHCTQIANEVRQGGEIVPWEMFYADPRIRAVVEDTLVAIAISFRRFEPRADWFLIVMNTDPQSVSLGASMFLPKPHGEKRDHEFAEANFVRLFKALFASVHPVDFDEVRRAAFVARYGNTPEVAFGHLFVALTEMEQQFGGGTPPPPAHIHAGAAEVKRPPPKKKR
jgi:hypothetical protein